MYKNIAVIYGSDTSEWEVSCRSGEYTASRIDDYTYSVYEILARFGSWELLAYRKKGAMRTTFPEGSRPQVDKNDFSVNIYGEHIKLDYAYIMQHGAPGENGILQAYFDIVSVPYNTANSFVSALVFDKFSCKSYLRNSGLVQLSKDSLVKSSDDVDLFCQKTLSTLSLPLFVKPTSGGSSFGITKVKEASQLKQAILLAFNEGDNVIVEEEIKGRELTCAAYWDGESVKTLPIIEIVTDNEFFDYDAKYNGNSSEICPAPITKEWEDEIKAVTTSIYKYFSCRGIVRMDYIYSEKGLYFLEINTIPGMTSASLVPKMIREAGINITSLLSTIIEKA